MKFSEARNLRLLLFSTNCKTRSRDRFNLVKFSSHHFAVNIVLLLAHYNYCSLNISPENKTFTYELLITKSSWNAQIFPQHKLHLRIFTTQRMRVHLKSHKQSLAHLHSSSFSRKTLFTAQNITHTICYKFH
jgi:hypothetical protein